MHELLYKKFLTFLTRIMERMVDFSQYCTVLAEPAARSQIALIDTRGAHPTLALGNTPAAVQPGKGKFAKGTFERK